MKKIADELNLLEEKGQLRKIPQISEKTDGKIVVDSRKFINFASNDYLGISTKVELVDEFLQNNKEYYEKLKNFIIADIEGNPNSVALETTTDIVSEE